MKPTNMTFLKDPNQEVYYVHLLEVGECTVTVQYVHSGNQELIDLADVVFNNSICLMQEPFPSSNTGVFYV